MTRFPGLLAVVLALQALEAAAGDVGNPRLVLVVRTGALAREEISPASRAAAGETWSLAAAGVALTNVIVEGSSGAEVPLDRLKAALLPESVLSLEGKGDETAFLALDLAEGARDAARKALEPPGLQELRQRFGSPPAREPAEDAALEAIDEGVGGEPSLAALEAGKKRLPNLEDIGKAKVALVRIAAGGDSVEKVLERDNLLRRILDLAGDGAHVLVVNVPAAGPGSAFARGPRLKAGRVFESPRSLKAVAALVSALTGARKDPDGAKAKEPESWEEIHDLLR
jgi:hypothetical protein